MIIEKYMDCFHDGSLAIERQEQNYIFSMESAEMDAWGENDTLLLSERGTIKGKLHLENVQSIQINDSIIKDELKMKYDYGSIFDFNIQNNIVELKISWRNTPKKPYVNDFSTLLIKATNIWWENIPDLYDPFW